MHIVSILPLNESNNSLLINVISKLILSLVKSCEAKTEGEILKISLLYT